MSLPKVFVDPALARSAEGGSELLRSLPRQSNLSTPSRGVGIGVDHLVCRHRDDTPGKFTTEWVGERGSVHPKDNHPLRIIHNVGAIIGNRSRQDCTGLFG